jgi:hypothetical protein
MLLVEAALLILTLHAQAERQPTFGTVLGTESIQATVLAVEGELRQEYRRQEVMLEIEDGFSFAIVSRITPLRVPTTDKAAVAERLQSGFRVFMNTLIQEKLAAAARRLVVLTAEAATAIRGARYCGMIPCDQPPCCTYCDPPPCVTPTVTPARHKTAARRVRGEVNP